MASDPVVELIIDFAASFDSLDIMEWVMRHFYLRDRIEERMGAQADWNAVDTLMQIRRRTKTTPSGPYGQDWS